MTSYPIPPTYNRACPYLICDHAAQVLEFILKTFDAEDRGAMKTPEGKIAHAEVKIGDSVIMVSDCMPDQPKIPGMVHVYVENCDEVFAKAVANGATVDVELQTFPYGDRSGGVKDMGGNSWWISSHVEDVSEEELERRMNLMRKES